MSNWLASLRLTEVLVLIAVLTVIRLIMLRSKKRLAITILEFIEPALYAFTVVFLVIRPMMAETCYVPSGSMEPTLRGDKKSMDWLFTDKISYRVHKPKKGDVVVFIPPKKATEGDSRFEGKGNVYFIKRLIGWSGDKITVTAGWIDVNGQRISHRTVRNALADANVFGPDANVDPIDFMAIHHVKFVKTGVYADDHFISIEDLRPILTKNVHARVVIHPGYVMRNDVKLDEPYIAEDPDYDYKIVEGEPLRIDYSDDSYRYRYNGDPIDIYEYRRLISKPAESVPQHSYLMMGDNRNDSSDGTCWGFVSDEKVVGKAQVILWPPNRIARRL